MSNALHDSLRWFGIVAVVLVTGLTLAACGGGDDGGDEAPAPVTTTTEETVALTTDDLIEQGDAICAEVNAALGSIEASTADEETKSTQIADIYDGLAARLGDLGTPTDGDPPTDVIAAAQQIADGSTDTTTLQAAASEYGFTDCAEAPEAVAYPTDPGAVDPSGTESTETYVPPVTETVPETTPPPVTTPPSTGGGVAPTPPSTGGDSGGSSGGTSSGGIGPG